MSYYHTIDCFSPSLIIFSYIVNPYTRKTIPLLLHIIDEKDEKSSHLYDKITTYEILKDVDIYENNSQIC